ncbi:hypothetical protein VTJ04DRAFT_7240 [Mycothermus thermophilus]|uniref:uncharacterized protein n=1 Tax=Humicola insolens TaxID=85995 RepID=UPI0037434074
MDSQALATNRPIFPSAGPTPRHLIPLEALDSLYQSLAARHLHVLECQHIFSDDHQNMLNQRPDSPPQVFACIKCENCTFTTQEDRDHHESYSPLLLPDV